MFIIEKENITQQHLDGIADIVSVYLFQEIAQPCVLTSPERGGQKRWNYKTTSQPVQGL